MWGPMESASWGEGEGEGGREEGGREEGGREGRGREGGREGRGREGGREGEYTQYNYTGMCAIKFLMMQQLIEHRLLYI